MCRHQWEKNPSPVKSWKGDRLVANSTANSSEELSHIYHPAATFSHINGKCCKSPWNTVTVTICSLSFWKYLDYD